MSKNKHIRKLAEDLPNRPKLHNGRVQRDGAYQPIMVNHFKVIKEIERTQGKQAAANYVVGLKAGEEAFYRSQKRRKTIRSIIVYMVLFFGLLALGYMVHWNNT